MLDFKHIFLFLFKRILDLSFEEACRGVNKTLEIKVLDTCKSCQGSKCAPGHKPTRCKQCNGTGMESVQTGPFFMRTTCRACYGIILVLFFKNFIFLN